MLHYVGKLWHYNERKKKEEEKKPAGSEQEKLRRFAEKIAEFSVKEQSRDRRTGRQTAEETTAPLLSLFIYSLRERFVTPEKKAIISVIFFV